MENKKRYIETIGITQDDFNAINIELDSVIALADILTADGENLEQGFITSHESIINLIYLILNHSKRAQDLINGRGKNE